MIPVIPIVMMMGLYLNVKESNTLNRIWVESFLIFVWWFYLRKSVINSTMINWAIDVYVPIGNTYRFSWNKNGRSRTTFGSEHRLVYLFYCCVPPWLNQVIGDKRLRWANLFQKAKTAQHQWYFQPRRHLVEHLFLLLYDWYNISNCTTRFNRCARSAYRLS